MRSVGETAECSVADPIVCADWPAVGPVNPRSTAGRLGVVRLAFTGDVCLGSGAFDHAKGRSLPELLSPFSQFFSMHDLVVGNLEFAPVPDDAPEELLAKMMAVTRSRIKGLRESGFGAFTLANNHIMDCGRIGLETAMSELAEQGVLHFGAGLDRAEATRPLRVELAGIRISLLGACDYSAHFASDRRPGIAPLTKELEALVAEERSRSDLLVVVLHGDLEFTGFPAPWRVRASRRLVEVGADLVVQHHPHVSQGYERYRGGLIAYSLGNFVFKITGNAYQGRIPETANGLVLSVEVQFQGGQRLIRPSFVPVVIGDEHFPRISDPLEGETAQWRLAELSAGLASAQRVRHAWRDRCDHEFRDCLYSVYYLLRRRRYAMIMERLGLIARIPEERRWLRGWLTRGWL